MSTFHQESKDAINLDAQIAEAKKKVARADADLAAARARARAAAAKQDEAVKAKADRDKADALSVALNASTPNAAAAHEAMVSRRTAGWKKTPPRGDRKRAAR